MMVYRSPFDVVEALGRGDTVRVPMKAPIQPATPCPDCIDGRKMVDGYGYPFPCPTCNGTRWVGGDLGLVTEHGRLIHDGEATSWKPIGSKPLCPHVERRLVVPWRTQVTELWEVVEGDDGTIDVRRVLA